MDNVKEIYEYNRLDRKYVLMIGEDGSVKLTDYSKTDGIEMHNPVIVDIAGGKGCKRIEYGINPTAGRSSIPFKNWGDGELDKHWTQIK